MEAERHAELGDYIKVGDPYPSAPAPGRPAAALRLRAILHLGRHYELDELPWQDSPLWWDRWYTLATRLSCFLHGHIWRDNPHEPDISRDCAPCGRFEVRRRLAAAAECATD